MWYLIYSPYYNTVPKINSEYKKADYSKYSYHAYSLHMLSLGLGCVTVLNSACKNKILWTPILFIITELHQWHIRILILSFYLEL